MVEIGGVRRYGAGLCGEGFEVTTLEEIEATGDGLVGTFGGGLETWSKDEEFEMGEHPCENFVGRFVCGDWRPTV